MLFTWDATDLCVVFRQWHITSTLSLAVSLVAIVGICAGYEALREATRRYEAVLSQRVETAPRKSFTFPSLISLRLAVEYPPALSPYRHIPGFQHPPACPTPEAKVSCSLPTRAPRLPLTPIITTILSGISY